ncbi:MAG: DsrE family protein [Burkholderiales bacterium]|nr:DsrE family protein [Burkholderiales bacterium]
MAKTLFVLNDQPYGTERSYNALRLAGSLSKVDGEEVRLFFMGDAVSCAKSGQKVPEGFYNLELMIGKVARTGAEIGLCGTCMDARGIADTEIVNGARPSTLAELTTWTQWAEKVLVF